MNAFKSNYRLLPKICDWAKYQNRHNSKSIRVTKLSFCQSDFGKITVWSLIYFLIYAYLNIIAQLQILGNSL